MDDTYPRGSAAHVYIEHMYILLPASRARGDRSKPAYMYMHMHRCKPPYVHVCMRCVRMHAFVRYMHMHIYVHAHIRYDGRMRSTRAGAYTLRRYVRTVAYAACTYVCACRQACVCLRIYIHAHARAHAHAHTCVRMHGFIQMVACCEP